MDNIAICYLSALYADITGISFKKNISTPGL